MQGGLGLGLFLCAATLLAPPCAAATVNVDFDAPRRGPMCVSAAVGDQLKFSWDEYHNLHEMPDRASYDECKFGAATELAPAAPNPEGVVVELPSTGTRFFACSKICASNGHKVKVCVSSGAAQACDCPEGRSVGPSPSPPAAGAGQTSGTAAPASKTMDVVSAASTLRLWQLWSLSLAVCAAAVASALSLELAESRR